MGGCRGLGLNGAMVPLVLCGQYVCSQFGPPESIDPNDAMILPSQPEKSEACPKIKSLNDRAKLRGHEATR
jgi:hypothetical protein